MNVNRTVIIPYIMRKILCRELKTNTQRLKERIRLGGFLPSFLRTPYVIIKTRKGDNISRRLEFQAAV